MTRYSLRDLKWIHKVLLQLKQCIFLKLVFQYLLILSLHVREPDRSGWFLVGRHRKPWWMCKNWFIQSDVPKLSKRCLQKWNEHKQIKVHSLNSEWSKLRHDHVHTATLSASSFRSPSNLHLSPLNRPSNLLGRTTFLAGVSFPLCHLASNNATCISQHCLHKTHPEHYT